MSALETLAQAVLDGRVGVKPYRLDEQDFMLYVDPPVDGADDDPEAFLDRVRALDAADKIAALQAMGFTPIGSSHQADCPYALDAGCRCNCVPDPTMWSPPHDVLVYTNQTYDERRRAPREVIPDVER